MKPRWLVASRKELDQAGFTRSRINSWIKSGRLVKVVRGVYSYGIDVHTREAAWRTGLLIAGEGSVLCGRSACELWGFLKPRAGLPRVVEVSTAKGNTRQLRGLSPALRKTRFRVRRGQWGTGDVRVREGITVLGPVLALIDFAGDASAKEVHFAFLEACRLKLFIRRDVDECFLRMAGRRGARKLRPLLEIWIPELTRIRSVFEGLFLIAWLERGLPVPKVNERIHGFEVDCYWPQYRVVLELDGAAFHSDPVQRTVDARKQKTLEDESLIVVRITYQEFMTSPEAAIRKVLGAFEAAHRKTA